MELAQSSDSEKLVWRSEDSQTAIYIVANEALCISHGGRGITKPFMKWIEDNWTPFDPDKDIAVANPNKPT